MVLRKQHLPYMTDIRQIEIPIKVAQTFGLYIMRLHPTLRVELTL
jgi:hypothetical protein